jgi:hypothetical protein
MPVSEAGLLYINDIFLCIYSSNLVISTLTMMEQGQLKCLTIHHMLLLLTDFQFQFPAFPLV